MSAVLYRSICEEIFRAVKEALLAEDPGVYSARSLCRLLCRKMHRQAAGTKGISGIFRFFRMIGEKRKFKGAFGCQNRHLFSEL